MTLLYYQLRSLPCGSAEQAVLSTEEWAAAQKRGKIYIQTRAVLRRELANRLGCTPQEIAFVYSEHGKPSLPGNPLYFNVSHSGDVLCLALHHAPIGVDVQKMRPLKTATLLAERIMCPQQLEAWQARGAQEKEFFDCWCAAEALVKHAGSTIWQAASHYPFLWHNGRIHPLSELSPQVQLLSPAPGYCGAVAFSTPEHPQP